MDKSNSRTIRQVLIKTVTTYAFSLVNYSQLSGVINTPTKHHYLLFRTVAFCLIPTIVAAQLFLDVVQITKNLLESPPGLTAKAVDFNVASMMGVRCTSPSESDTSFEQRERETRLADLADPEEARHAKLPWTWQRFGRILLALLALAQATGTIFLYVRRCDVGGAINIDGGNMIMAAASVLSSILALTLLVVGNEWKFASEAEPAAPRTKSQMRRLALELIMGGLLQETIAEIVKRLGLNHGTSWTNICPVPDSPVSLVHMLCRIAPSSAEEWLLFAVIALVIIFRNDIFHRLNIKIRRETVTVVLLWSISIWITVSAVAAVVVNMITLREMTVRNYPPIKWSDPLEENILVI